MVGQLCIGAPTLGSSAPKTFDHIGGLEEEDIIDPISSSIAFLLPFLLVPPQIPFPSPLEGRQAARGEGGVRRSGEGWRFRGALGLTRLRPGSPLLFFLLSWDHAFPLCRDLKAAHGTYKPCSGPEGTALSPRVAGGKGVAGVVATLLGAPPAAPGARIVHPPLTKVDDALTGWPHRVQLEIVTLPPRVPGRGYIGLHSFPLLSLSPFSSSFLPLLGGRGGGEGGAGGGGRRSLGGGGEEDEEEEEKDRLPHQVAQSTSAFPSLWSHLIGSLLSCPAVFLPRLYDGPLPCLRHPLPHLRGHCVAERSRARNPRRSGPSRRRDQHPPHHRATSRSRPRQRP